MRKTVLIAFVLMLFAQPSAFAQSTQEQIDDLKIQITLLMRLIAEQDRRITDLENQIKKGGTGSGDSPGSGTPDSSATGWKNPANWQRIKGNMSPQQVIVILGQPTRRKTGGLVRFFYEGTVSGSGYISGNVSFANNQVLVVSAPAF